MPARIQASDTVLLPVLLVLLWVAFLWASMGAFTHVVRSDNLSRRAKATWILLIVVLPFVSTLAIFSRGMG